MRRLAVVSLFAAVLSAQAPDDRHGRSRHGNAFDEGPRQAAYLMPGMSAAVHLPVADLSGEAQAFFDQGVTQLHGFWYFEAERSFRQVARLQPDCAMAYWGMAMANVEQAPRAAGLIAEAVRHSAHVPRAEQLWIDAWANYYQIDAACRDELRADDPVRVAQAVQALAAKNASRDAAALRKRLIKDLETLVYECPADLEAKAFLALQHWHNDDWGRGIPIGAHAAVDALLELVFQRAPDHPAHHYRIHLWDAEQAERALRSAAAIGQSAPGIAHQWHMASHVYRRLHRHGAAAWQQEASARVDHAHMQRDRVLPFLIHNYGHNQAWLCSSLSWRGAVTAALAVARNLAELPRHPRWNTLDDEQHIAAVARRQLVQICEDHALWAMARQLEREGYLEPQASVRGEVARLGLLGRAALRCGDRDAGDRIAAEVEALLAKARAARAAAVDAAEADALAKPDAKARVQEAMAEAGREPTDLVRAVLDLQRELRGERLLACGEASAAVAQFAAIDGFPKTLLADAWVAAGEPGKAIELLEHEVAERPYRLPTAARLLLACRAAASPEPAARAAELAALLRSDRFELQAPPSGGLAAAAGLLAPPPADDESSSAGTEAARLATFGPDFGPRPPLATLGPAAWRPFAAPDFDLPCASGGRRSLAGQRGRPVLIVCYLGFGCLHCVQQLEALSPRADDFAAAGIDVLAIGNEPVAAVAGHLAGPDAAAFAFPLLADPDLASFRAFGCHDDFEAIPLHGTFLVDAAGRVRWQDIGAEPFTRFDWLLAEARRLLALPAAD
ncbi:MAG: redoxin domain-containing protein [Planctomycetes bacterium]|nr:redoxin domain-containing protein [Planctomycetota bacterium]